MSPWAAHRRATRRAAGAAAAITAALALLPPLLGQFYYGLDLTRINLAMMCAVRAHLAGGGALQLSNLLGNGGPLLARPDAGLFYPPRWVALALPPDWGVAFEVALHLAICAAAGAWLARTFGVRAFTASAAGLALAGSGSALDLMRHAHYLVAAAWLPLIWAGARSALRRRSGAGAWVAVFAGCAGCLLGAEPQSYAIGVALVAIELGARVVRRRRPTRTWAALGLVCVGAFLVGLVQWVPSLSELALTPRRGNLPLSEVLSWSMTPSQWIGVVLPGMPTQWVQGVTTLSKVMSGDANTPPPWNKTPYLGAVILCAAVAGLALRRARVAAVVALGGTVFSLGGQLPVLGWVIGVVPMLARFRYPSKYWWVASVAVVVLAAVTIDTAARHRRMRRRLWLVGGTLGAALGAVWLAVRASAGPIDATAHALGTPGAGDLLPTLSQALAESVVHALVTLGVFLAVLTQRRLARYALGVACLDLFAAAPFALLTGPPMAGLPLPLAVPADAVLCVHPTLAGRFFPMESGGLNRSSLLFLRTHLVPELQACSGVAGGMPYSPLETSADALLALGVRVSNASAVRAFGCTHLVAASPFLPDAPTSVQPFVVQSPELPEPYDEIQLFALPSPLEPAFASADPVLSPTEADALARVARVHSRGELVAIVDDPLGHLQGQALPVGRPPVLTVARNTIDTKTVKVDGAGVIGFRTPYLVGWSADRDGVALPTVRIGAHSLGVVADRDGEITLRYRAPGAGLGWGLALAGLGVGAAALRIRRPRRR